MATTTHLSSLERYLCITDGFGIYCLDLKQGKEESKGYCSDLQPLPKIATLNLLEKGLPVSMGLFKLGSDAYLVSGQEFWGNHSGLKVPNELYERHGFKGSSRNFYHLSLAVDNASLSLLKCGSIPLLKKAKFWPIVEKIGDQIHVIESLPSAFEPPATIPSHEVLSLNDLGRGWIRLSTRRSPASEHLGFFTKDHMVLGDRIYATVHCYGDLTLVFDSKTNKWELHKALKNHVLRFFGFENGFCVKQVVKSGLKDPLYVVIGISHAWTQRKPLGQNGEDIPHTVLHARAHVINATGKVLCTQKLPRFFEGVEKVNAVLIKASLFRVDEQGSTLCAVVLAKDRAIKKEFLYISTFTVEEVPIKSSSSMIMLSTQTINEGKPTSLVSDFVKVVVKEWHVYRVEDDFRAGGDTQPTRLSACFI